MQHTYLRYECADAFSLTTSTASSTAPPTTSTLAFLGSSPSSPLLSNASSQIIGFNLRSLSPCIKIGHRDSPSGGIGSGRALNGDEVTCLDVSRAASESADDTVVKVATGWSDGTVRVFDLSSSEVAAAAAASSSSSSSHESNLGLVHSLLHDDEGGAGAEEFVTREPLVLNGHGSSPVRCVVFDRSSTASGAGAVVATRLASGGSDGAIIIWDIVAETGLFRLLGHRGAVTDISFVRPGLASGVETTASNMATFDGLITSSVEGLVKVWDLDGQCCAQTIANHRGEVSCSSAVRLGGNTKSSGDDDQDKIVGEGGRWRLVTGCADGAVRVWSVSKPKRIAVLGDDGEDMKDMNVEEEDGGKGSTASDQDDACRFIGTLSPPPNVATSNEKVAFIHFHPNGRYVGVCRTSDKTILIYLVRSEAKAQRKKTRRMRRRREKGGRKAAADNDSDTKREGKKRGILDDDESEDDEDNEQQERTDVAGLYHGVDPEAIQASDEFEYIATVRASHKIKGFTFAPFVERGGGIRVVCALATNALEVHSVVKKAQKVKGSDAPAIVYTATKLCTLDMYGHPTGVRSISLSSNDVLACTVSKSVTKVWNVANRSCLRSLPLASSSTSTSSGSSSASYYGLCSAFLPGNTHVVIGTREGHLLILDVASGDIVYIEENAHDGAVWSLDLRRPNPEHDEHIVIVTGSADKLVKFWDVERQEDAEEGAHHPMVVHTRSLQMSDDVVAVRYSYATDPAKRMVFVSSLDCTIKVFFDDTLKFFLSLYGHKLPALALDAADDDTILATGGADKTINIWGLDFGDTHRTMHGHTDSITDLKFVRRTHYFFTAGKDGTVRYWDADRFEQILLLSGHAAEVSCVAVSRTGAFALTGGMDRQVRVWERTKDIVFLEEERERELEAMFDQVDGSKGGDQGTAGILQRRRQGGDENELDEDDDAAGDEQPESEAAVRRSVLSVASGDRIMEAIELADQETKDIATFNRAQKGGRDGEQEKRRMPNPMLLGMEPPQYILWVLRTVKSADLEQSLLVLPLGHMERLLHYLILLLRSGRGVEICSKIAIFLVKTHQSQIVANRSLATPLRELKRLVKIRLAEIRDTVGFNQAALRAVAKVANDRKNAYFVPGNDDKDIWAGLGLGSDVAAALQTR